jgi:GcrA cell cycle regulator
MSRASGWTDDRIADLKKLWLEGRSAAEVARALSAGTGGAVRLTRNAVLGKIHRIGLSRPDRARATGDGSTAAERAAKRRDATNAAKAAVVRKMNAEPAKPRPPKVKAVPLAAIVSPNARPWMEREFGQCAWPLGEAGAIMSCCNPVARGSYCGAHARVAYDDRIIRVAGGSNLKSRYSVERQAVFYTRDERVDTYVPTGGLKPRTAKPASPWDDARAAA